MIRITKRARPRGGTRARKADFITHDGETLFCRHWPATGPRCRGAVVLLHRGHEHSARVVDELDLPDIAFFAWNARPLPLARRARCARRRRGAMSHP